MYPTAGLPDGQLLNSQASVRVVGVFCEDPGRPKISANDGSREDIPKSITSSALILSRCSYHDGVTTSGERVKESSDIHLGPAVIVGGDDVDRIGGSRN